MRKGVCYKCDGRGGFYSPNGWRPCSCRRPTRAQIEAQRVMNDPRGQLTIDDEIRNLVRRRPDHDGSQ